MMHRTASCVKSVFDPDVACRNLDVGMDELELFLPHALAEFQNRLPEVAAGVRQGELSRVALNSHTIKSVAASLGAESASRAAASLEQAARESRREDCSSLYRTMEQEVARLMEAITH